VLQLKDTINPYERVIFFIENFQLISNITNNKFTNIFEKRIEKKLVLVRNICSSVPIIASS
ncbi:MAG: hypothetical protein K1W38_25280, partial [Lachnospiraceae bacterium]